MARWKIKCYRNAHGRDLFDDDYADQTPEARAEFRAVLNGLRDQPDIQGWTRPEFDRLNGPYRDLGKLRFKANNTQHRPIGYFGPEKGDFTLLIWATEKGDKWKPPNVRDTALARMNEVKANSTRAHECDF